VVAKEDSTTHFDLGIAYKEMGLVDDAISEFTIAAQDPDKKASALSLIGLCYVEKGQYSEAINRFKDALHGPGISDHEATGVFYEMGQTYELLNDLAEALFYYRKVQKRDANFRDVDAKIKALKKPGGGEDDPDGSTKPPRSKSKISYM
jgi:tetratricopeptide (TPR) repeat protein